MIKWTSTIHLHSWPRPAPRHQMQTCRSSRSPWSAGKSVIFLTKSQETFGKLLAPCQRQLKSIGTCHNRAYSRLSTLVTDMFPDGTLMCGKRKQWSINHGHPDKENHFKKFSSNQVKFRKLWIGRAPVFSTIRPPVIAHLKRQGPYSSNISVDFSVLQTKGSMELIVAVVAGINLKNLTTLPRCLRVFGHVSFWNIWGLGIQEFFLISGGAFTGHAAAPLQLQ